MVERNPMAMFGERGPREGRAIAGGRFHPTVAMLAVAALLAGGPAAFASTLTFKAELSGGGEAPPNNSAGKGHVSATLDTDTKTLTWSVTYSGVTGAPIGAHFHGPVSYVGMTSEENAPIQVLSLIHI